MFAICPAAFTVTTALAGAGLFVPGNTHCLPTTSNLLMSQYLPAGKPV
jgi:hypothetical protein